MTTIVASRLAELENGILAEGGHSSMAEGACAMEWVSYIAGLGFTDAPDCASPVLRRYIIALNDRWPRDRRQLLKPFLPRMVGTGGDGKDPLREQIATTVLCERLLEPWLRLAGMDAEADSLADLDGLDQSARYRALSVIQTAAWDLRQAKRAELRAEVAERLKDRPAAAVDAAADVAADAAAAAAVDVDPWGSTYSAAYRAARKYYDEHPLPVMAQITELAASQQDVALELLDRMIDPAVPA